MTKIEAIISDSDGTLIDTVGLIRHGQYETAKRYLTQYGIPADEIPSYPAYNDLLTQTVGGSARHTLEATMRLLYADSAHYLEGMDFEQLHDMLNPVQDELASTYVKAYAGLSEFLHGLGKLGMKFAIFTSGTPHHVVRNFGIALPELAMRELYKDTSYTDHEKLRMFEQQFATEFGMPSFTVVTADDTERHKPEPDSLNLAMKRLGGVKPSAVAVLGDHKVDMLTAARAMVDTRVGITHGFDDEATLRAHGASHIAHDFADVTRVLQV